ncbi:MAG TPA: peptidase E [Actinomycetota bacterium]|jgi:peptidase E|nr:peptidase E [Actinomycetota bacterium]
MAERHVVALGGGGFSDWAGAVTPLDRFILSLAPREEPRVCFVPTASGDAALYVERFYAAFSQIPCRPSHLSLFGPPYPRLPDKLLEQDVIYVGGGSTANLLAVWRLHGVDAVLGRVWSEGVVLAGISAGSLCWFEGGVTDSFGALRPLPDGLGILPGTNCPHYDSEPDRRPTYQRAVGDGALAAGIAADDGVALHFEGTDLVEVVSERPSAAAYRVEREVDGVRETRIEPTLLPVEP